MTGGAQQRPARGRSLAANGQGAVHLVWTVAEDPAADIHYVRSTDGGRSFTEPRVIAGAGGHADAPQLAAGADGTLHLLYAHRARGPWQPARILYSRSDADGRFRSPQVLAEPEAMQVTSLGFPSLAVKGEAVVAVWELFPRVGHRSLGSGISHTRDGGVSWQPPGVVPNTADPEFGITGSLQGLLMRKLAVDGHGELAVDNSSFLPSDISRALLIRGELTGQAWPTEDNRR